jgi:hypothetical protein
MAPLRVRHEAAIAAPRQRCMRVLWGSFLYGNWSYGSGVTQGTHHGLWRRRALNDGARWQPDFLGLWHRWELGPMVLRWWNLVKWVRRSSLVFYVASVGAGQRRSNAAMRKKLRLQFAWSICGKPIGDNSFYRDSCSMIWCATGTLSPCWLIRLGARCGLESLEIFDWG